jgi:hypothetical protein
MNEKERTRRELAAAEAGFGDDGRPVFEDRIGDLDLTGETGPESGVFARVLPSGRVDLYTRLGRATRHAQIAGAVVYRLVEGRWLLVYGPIVADDRPWLSANGTQKGRRRGWASYLKLAAAALADR